MAAPGTSTAPYIDGWRRRAESREREREARQVSARETAVRLAERLVQEAGAEAVWLIGTAVDPARFRLGSDVDLAVSGVAGESFFRVWAELEQDCGFELDLIRLEWAPESLRRHVRSCGQLLASREVQG